MKNDWKPSDAPRSFGILYDETYEALGIPKPVPVRKEKSAAKELPAIPVIGECDPSPFTNPCENAIIWATTYRDAVAIAMIAEELGRPPNR